MWIAEPPDYDTPEKNFEAQCAFWGLLVWHLFLALIKFRAYKEKTPVNFVTVLMLIQIIILAYLIEYWLIPLLTGWQSIPQMRWLLWVQFEASIVIATILGCMLSLLLRALISQFYDRQDAMPDSDIIDKDITSIDEFNMFMGPGFSYLILTVNTYFNFWVIIFLVNGLMFGASKYANQIYRDSGNRHVGAARFVWWATLIVMFCQIYIAIETIIS